MAISTATQALVREAGADLGEAAQEAIGRLLFNVGQMSKTIDALLECSRAGNPTGYGQVDCDQLVRAELERCATGLEEIGASVTVAPLGHVAADGDQVRSVFANLLQNAIRYRREDQPLRVVVSVADGVVEREFTVADNGRGIAPEDRERALRMFERLGAAGEGTGMGLAVCQRIVEAHGGRIWITGNEMGGTTVHFTLPRHDLTT
jgi:chemotaxis family two-component system sensor kinase Cph1